MFFCSAFKLIARGSSGKISLGQTDHKGVQKVSSCDLVCIPKIFPGCVTWSKCRKNISTSRSPRYDIQRNIQRKSCPLPRVFRRYSFSGSVPWIIALNIGVFILWHAATRESSLIFMADNFLVSWTGLTEGRIWTLLTSEFSHNLLIHIFINMFVLNSFGPIVESVLGKKTFLLFYLLAAVVSSLCHSLVSAWILGEPDLPALGASGAISGLVLLFSMLFPKQKILIFGLIPIPALWGALLFIGLDIWGLIAQAEGGGLPIGHGAHLGGALTGILFYFLYLRRKRFQFIG
ncbi:MAG: hypothetical protein COT73_04770 [Bdellovibrio sp. CG10_big_fil_rev_8_21_14_0_10_47_8]|nr:MAG: hypothetical protein COT73_04770 [Bdellovibrio sp. CG10_big_fil_rev_8_21_14_0_10_47_8]